MVNIKSVEASEYMNCEEEGIPNKEAASSLNEREGDREPTLQAPRERVQIDVEKNDPASEEIKQIYNMQNKQQKSDMG